MSHLRLLKSLSELRLKTPSQNTISSLESIMDHVLLNPSVLCLSASAMVNGAEILPTRSLWPSCAYGISSISVSSG